jgi:Putative phage tail protein
VSNLGQAALIIVGTVVGAYFGAPQLGFVLGSLAGAELFPTQLPPGPQIKSNRTTTASVGDPVPIVFGTADVSGTVIFLSPVVESTTETRSSKGGPEQKTYNYYQTIAIGLCERVDDTAADAVGAIAGLSRIWENGTIVYDIRPQQAANSDLDLLAETDAQYAQRLTVSAVYAETFTLYLGDELQLADPTIEATQGVGKVPAFRGLAYIVYPNRNLQEAQGFRHPTFRFECYQSGIGDCTTTNETSTEVLYPWVGGGTENPADPRNINTYQIIVFDDRITDPATGLTYFGEDYAGFVTAIYPSEGDALAVLNHVYGTSLKFVGCTGYPYTDATHNPNASLVPQTGATPPSGVQGVAPDYGLILCQYWFDQPTAVTIWKDYAQRYAHAYGYVVGNVYWEEINTQQAQILWTVGPTFSGATPPAPALVPPYETVALGIGVYPWDFATETYYELSYSAGVVIARAPNVPPDPCYGLTPSILPGFSLMLDGSLVKCGAWTLTVDPHGTPYKALQAYSNGGGYSAPLYPLNPCLAPTDPNYNNATFWTNAYNAAVAAGYMPAGMAYQTAPGIGYPTFQNFIYSNDIEICSVTVNEVSLGQIITAVCKRAGLTSIDIDDMVPITIPGYSVSNICSATEILQPLRSVGFFDAVESSGVMRFQARGKAVVAILGTDDIGAYESTGDSGSSKSSVPPSVSTARAQDEDLPRMIRFKYKAVSRDYEDGEQDSPFRLATKAVNDVDASIPICLGDIQAAQCAEVLWADSWASRTSYEIAIDQSWPQLEVGDCIGIPVDGVTQRVRIVSETTSSGVLRKLKCVSDDSGAYISFAVASWPLSLPSVLTYTPPTAYQLLDLPCLLETDNDPGFYVAAEPSVYGATWNGCVIYKSIDGGITFASALALAQATTMGTISETGGIPASQALTWDDDTIIEVTVADASISFESRTDDAVLAGANAACMGADRRWEIVQFANASKTGPLTWQLSRLLRGRRGTEHVIGSSRFGDLFVMVSTGTIGRIVLASTEIGASRVYNAVSIGAPYATTNEQTFTGHGEALVCFSPENPAAQYDTAGNVVISWIRRSRLGQTLMSGVDIPLGEATESFSIDILELHSPGSPEIVLRTLTSSICSVIYTRADFEADSGSPLPSTIKVAIYQLSAITGRGTPQIAVLTIAGV